MKIKRPRTAIAFTSLILVASALFYWAPTPLKEEFLAPTDRYYPKAYPILEKEDFALCYDGKNKIPLWTWEKLYGEKPKLVSRKQASFKEDSEVYPHHRSSLKDYKNSGYDRGHLSPAHHHTDNEKAMQDSFLLSNICPMPALFNRGVWKQLENYAFELSKKMESLTVVSGPLFLENNKQVSYALLGENSVAIPTHFFKVLYITERDETKRVEVFVIDAHNPPSSIYKNKANNEFHPAIVKTLDYLETVSAMVFERDLPK